MEASQKATTGDTCPSEDKDDKNVRIKQVQGRGVLLQCLLECMEHVQQQLQAEKDTMKTQLLKSPSEPPPPTLRDLLLDPLLHVLRTSQVPPANLASILRQASMAHLVDPPLIPFLLPTIDLLLELSRHLASQSPPFPAHPISSPTWKIPCAPNPTHSSRDDTPCSRDQISPSALSPHTHSFHPLVEPSDTRIPSPIRRPPTGLAQLRLLSDPLSLSLSLSNRCSSSSSLLSNPHSPYASRPHTPPPPTPPHLAPPDSDDTPVVPTPKDRLPITPNPPSDHPSLSPLQISSQRSDDLATCAMLLNAARTMAAAAAADFDRTPGGRTAPAPTIAILKPTMVQLVTENGAIGAKFRPMVRSSSPAALMLAGVVTPAGSTGGSSSSSSGTPRVLSHGQLSSPIPTAAPATNPPPPPPPSLRTAPAQCPANPNPTAHTPPTPLSKPPPPPAAPAPKPASPPTFTDITNAPLKHPTLANPSSAATPAPAAVLSVARPTKAPVRQLPPTVSELLEYLRNTRPDVRKHLDKGHITILKEAGPTCAACITHFQLAKMPGNWIQHHEVSNPPAYLHGIISRIAHLLQPEQAQALLHLKARRPDIAEAVDLRACECVLEEEVSQQGLLEDVVARLEQQLPQGWTDGRAKRRACADMAVRIKRVMREAIVDRVR